MHHTGPFPARFFLVLLTGTLILLVGGIPMAQEARSDRYPNPRIAMVPSLQAQLDAQKTKFQMTAPSEMQKAFEQGVEDVRRSGVVDRAKNTGDRAPDFVLHNAVGEKVRLLDLAKEGPVVLTWYRGGWCPYCNLQLRAYQMALPEIQANGGNLVAISPETPDNSLTTAQRDQLEFEVLSDIDNRVAREYGLVYEVPSEVLEHFEGHIDLAAYNGNTKNELPLAATYVIDRDGVIRYAFVDADYRKRAETDILVSTVRKLMAD